MYDVIVIGGGAAGIAAAISAGRLGAKVLILEKNKKLGKKLYATGNGKCNLANEDTSILKNYFSWGEFPDFLNKVFLGNPMERMTDFVHSIGVGTYAKNGYIYPLANQASAVVWAMLDELSRVGVEIVTNTAVTELAVEPDRVRVMTAGEVYVGKHAVLACGGKSYESLGGSSMGYELVKALGVELTPIKPALCPVVTKQDLSNASGVRVAAFATLFVDEVFMYEERGELQITDYGLTGIMIFNFSSYAARALTLKKKAWLSIDFVPQLSRSEIWAMLSAAKERTCLGFLNGLINDKLARLLLHDCKIDAKKKTDCLTKTEINRLLDSLTSYRADITGLKDYNQAQVCSGGVCLSEIDADSMRLKKYGNIYVAGELVDIDGKCGGYNLTFAILSGIKAGTSAYAYD
ncbi:MAG: aminoacetone oxidase family FAD-binding enzyme [Clostridium sp.]|nr:aminoacetone oxidase family FAD-binding enzyme [Clostridium sp.]MCM1398849.1 aminoacetone oxidase family FAD-binding enzyme [Clostridium sp.]MCM1458520.1 aminoacetone oxidase family FAD-binding enzyme [Bacteroides sp.]